VKIGQADPEILWLRVSKSGMTQNWLPWQRPLRNRKNWTGSKKFTQIPSIWNKIVKIGPIDTEIALLKVKKKKKKKKLTQAKYIALPASLPSGLDNKTMIR